MDELLFFGIRHLSPAGAFHLRKFLDQHRPGLVLVEGPEDFSDQLDNLVRPETAPPIAILAYTKEAPVQTILYPFAEYSPEYQAVLWCQENHAECRFIDLPSEVFLALEEQKRGNETEETKQTSPYDILDRQTGEDGHETFWERTLEHTLDTEGYRQGSNSFGAHLRELSENIISWEGKAENQKKAKAGEQSGEVAGEISQEISLETSQEMGEASARQREIAVREAYMSRKILAALKERGGSGPVVVVTGAYHVEGLKRALDCENTEQALVALMNLEEPLSSDAAVFSRRKKELPMTDEEAAALPRISASHTLMPYSYYRLSSRSGYGAGNKAPAYYHLLWEALNREDPYFAVYSYLSRLAGFQRTHGTPVSSAEVIEAVRLSCSLAKLRSGGSPIPALRDLRDAAVTCMGGGKLSTISLAIADTEIGTVIGALPDGVSRTSIQEDFYRQLREVKLEQYRALTAQELALDLRENRRVKTEKAAFLDLHRSFFLHQLRVLRLEFARQQAKVQDNATWSEHWVLSWTPETEIRLVESALKGDTIAQAASFVLKERVENSEGIGGIARVIEDAFTCGMPAAVTYASNAMQAMAVDASAVGELAVAAHALSAVMQYGTIRQLSPEPLKPLLRQIFYRACLLLPVACCCDDSASKTMAEAIELFNGCALAHDFLDQEAWLKMLREVADRDDLNAKLSGLCAGILLERGLLDSAQLHIQAQRRLSPGASAELGAGWFEGLAMKNRYALIARLSLWDSLNQYIESLDYNEFKRALVFLRRAFADFTAAQKDEIAENLGELWGLNGQQISEAVNQTLTGEAKELVESLEDFDFDF